MAENYSLNSAFGFNITQQKSSKLPSVKETVENIDAKVGSLFDNMTGYMAKYENVLTGEVEREINMYNRQAMFVGMNMRAAEDSKPNFDMNI